MADLKTEGKLDRIKGRARAIWGNLTDHDFDKARGSTEDLIGRIKEKTGETTEEIRRKVWWALLRGRGTQHGGKRASREAPRDHQ